MSYCDVTYADSYLAAGAFADAWTGDKKSRYLETASRFIRQFCSFVDADGEPCVYAHADAPCWPKDATAEEALYLVTLAKDPTAADKKTTLGIQSTDGTVFDKAFAADVLGPACRRILEANGGTVSAEAVADGGRRAQWGYVDK